MCVCMQTELHDSAFEASELSNDELAGLYRLPLQVRSLAAPARSSVQTMHGMRESADLPACTGGLLCSRETSWNSLSNGTTLGICPALSPSGRAATLPTVATIPTIAWT